MTEHPNPHAFGFRPLAPGWYIEATYDDGEIGLLPCPGLACNIHGNWEASVVDGRYAEESNHTSNLGELVYRPDLAHLPGDLEVRVVDGVEYVRQSKPTTRRVLGPDTPWPISKMEA